MPWLYRRGLRRLRYVCSKTQSALTMQIGAVGKRQMAQFPIRIQPTQKLSEEDWLRHSQEIAAGLQDLLAGPEGQALRDLLDEQVSLITSLPLEAARRVQELALEAVSGQKPRQTIIEEIMRSGAVALSRADLIARTEVGRANAALTQVRAEKVGSPGYYWRTSHDDLVRPIHRRLDGKFFEWDNPPVALNTGQRGHPGETPNCRCWADPVLPGETPRGRVRLRAS